MISDKSIVITGGAGFVGNALCKMLSESNKVISIDNYFTGTTQNHFGGVKYLEGCASDIGDLVKSKVDYVFHLGEYSRVEQSFDDWEFCLENNSMPIIKVLDFCVKTAQNSFIAVAVRSLLQILLVLHKARMHFRRREMLSW
jgi:UDP-glucose 4-epimerase